MYHNFIKLGIKTNSTEYYQINQQCKENIIINMIEKASKEYKTKWVELFGADGYYSAIAIKAGVKDCDVIEKNIDYINSGKYIIEKLNYDKFIKFNQADVNDISKAYNVCICAGGLYHLNNPEKLIKKLSDKIKKVLIIQTVILKSSKNEIIKPAPSWHWGCRFTQKYIEKVLSDKWNIKEFKINELRANKKETDKYSYYAYCEKK